MTRGLALVALVAPLALPAQPTTAQEDADVGLGAEGPLRNDGFVPRADEAEQRLLAGDTALTEARTLDEPRAAQRALVRALDEWHAAATGPGGATRGGVAYSPGTGTPRTLEGVEAALARRLDGLVPAERALWIERVGAQADAALAEHAGRPRVLAAVERRHPRTRAAALAALALADLAFERGRGGDAAVWIARAAGHAAFAAPGDAALAGALQARRAARPARPAPGPPGFDDALALEPTGRVVLESTRPGGARSRRPATLAGLRPGLTTLADGRVAVQTPGNLHLVEVDPEGRLERGAAFEPHVLIDGLVGWPPRAWSESEPPGWPLLPATDGVDLLLVLGRGGPGAEPNTLACVRPPARRGRGVAPPLPRLRWAVQAGARVAPGGSVLVPEALLAPCVEADVQPGPVVVDGRVLALLRAGEAESEAWLAAFDLVDGRPLWLRYLGKGAPVVRDLGRAARSASGYEARRASPPPTRVGARLFADTHLGAGFLVDALDGRLVWSFRDRRRRGSEAGWSGWRAPRVDGPDGPLLLWAPPDSDRLYRLRATPLPAPDGGGGPAAPQIAPPARRGEAAGLLGGDARSEVCLGRDGARWTVFERTGSRRVDAPWLPPSERFAGPGLVSPRRALAVTDRGIHLLDRSRDLMTLDFLPLEGVRSGESVSLHARGDLVLALGAGTLWSCGVR